MTSHRLLKPLLLWTIGLPIWPQIALAQDIVMSSNGQCTAAYVPYDDLCLAKAALDRLSASEMAAKIREFEASRRAPAISALRNIFEEAQGLWLTPEMHSEFWSLLKSAWPDKGQRAEVVAFFQDMSAKLLPWQEAAHESFLLSYRSGEEQWTKEYLEQEDYWKRFQNEQVENARAMNRAAATKQPLSMGGGQVLVTEDLITSTLENLEVGKFRWDRLLTEEWSSAPRLFEYPKLGLNLLWDEPWLSETEVLKIDGEQLVNHMINLEKPNGDGWQIAMTGYPSPAATPLKNQRRTLEGTGKSLGVTEHLQYERDWRGLESSIQTGTFVYEGIEYLVKISATYIPALQAMMQKMVWSTEAATTQVEFERLAQAVMFIDENYAVASSNQRNAGNQKQLEEKLAKEMQENGVGEEAIEAALSAHANISKLDELDTLEAAYGDLLKLSDREIAIELSLDPRSKARIGLAEAVVARAAVNFPVYLDEYTSYTGVHYDLEAGSLVYHYTMPSDAADMIMSLSPLEQKKVQKALEEGNANSVCEISLPLLTRGFNMTYSYRNPAGKELFQVVRTYADCTAQGY